MNTENEELNAEKEEISNKLIKECVSGRGLLVLYYLLEDNVPANQVIEKVKQLSDPEVIIELKQFRLYDIWLESLARIEESKGIRILPLRSA